MRNLLGLRILIIGSEGTVFALLPFYLYILLGVGVETAKNLILAGPKEVVLVDNGKVEAKDLGTNFFFSDSDIGKVRSQVCIDQLSILNPYVEVSGFEGYFLLLSNLLPSLVLFIVLIHSYYSFLFN
jgi:ubiquitin-activating enzyme E1